MLVKICGMRNTANIKQVAALKPDLLGFIFYPKSKRYVGENFDAGIPKSFPIKIKTVGVFVNEDFQKLISISKQYLLNYIQLHGNETPEYCKEVRDKGIKIFKAFGINDSFNWKLLEPYLNVCDYFLFDTSSANHGGTGIKFNWDLLDHYTLKKPFLLSGGIGPDDAAKIKTINHKQLAGIDINSQFELEPAVKDLEKLEPFLNELRS